jgi:hypothetical protein
MGAGQGKSRRVATRHCGNEGRSRSLPPFSRVAVEANLIHFDSFDEDPAVRGLLQGMRLAESPPLRANQDEFNTQVTALNAASLLEEDDTSAPSEYSDPMRLGRSGVDLLWEKQDATGLQKLCGEIDEGLERERHREDPDENAIMVYASLVAYAEARLAQLSKED